MKRSFLALALLVSLAGAAEAQRPQVQVTAKRRTDSDGNGSQSFYSFRSKEQRQVLDISLRNLDRTARDCQVQWYFTARPAGGGQRFIYDSGSASIKLDGTATTNLPASSATLRSEKSDFYSDGRTRHSGSEAEGYFVLVGIDGQVVASTASTRPLQQIISNAKTLQELLATANADRGDGARP